MPRALRPGKDKGASIRLACQSFGISETCYRYQSKLSSENAIIADWLIRLTHSQKKLELWSVLFVSSQHQKIHMEP
jgi:hypothetical protein